MSPPRDTARHMKLAPEDLERFNAALDELQWTDERLTRQLGISLDVPAKWRMGLHPIPNWAWAYIDQCVLVKRAYDPLKPCATWRTHGRGNPKRRARMDAQALQRFKDAGKL